MCARFSSLLCLTALALVVFPLALSAGEQPKLAAEKLLPSYKGKDAYRPGAGFGKDVFLVVWQADRMQKGDLVACRINEKGESLEAEPFVVSGAPDDQERPRVAFGKGVFLVVWQDLRNGKDYDVYAARVSPEGKVLEPKGLLIAGGKFNQSRPRLTFDGENFVVVWEDLRNGKNYKVFGARVSPAGKILDEGGSLLAEAKGMHRYMPAAASFGDGRTLVVWCGTKFWVGRGTRAGSLFVRDGKVEKRNGSLEGIKDRNGSIGGGGRGGTPVDLAAGKDGFLVLWRNHRPVGRTGGGGRSNCALFMDKNGVWEKGKTLNLTGRTHVAMDPAAAWDGAGFVAAWTEQPSVRRSYGVYEKVVAARTDSKGKPLSGTLAVSGTFKAPANRVAVASTGAGTTLIVYEKHPETAKVPIKIGFRIMTAAAGSSAAE